MVSEADPANGQSPKTACYRATLAPATGELPSEGVSPANLECERLKDMCLKPLVLAPHDGKGKLCLAAEKTALPTFLQLYQSFGI